MISVDELGIWNNLGTVSPVLNQFTAFPSVTTNYSVIFRIYCSSPYGVGNTKTYLRQSIGNLVIDRWVRVFPENNLYKIIYLSLPDYFLNQQIERKIEAFKLPRYYRNGNDADPSFSLQLEQFIPFKIPTNYDNETLKQAIKEAIKETNQETLRLPPNLL